MSKRSEPWRSRGIFMMATWLIGGCVFIVGVGISNVHRARQISQHGVTVNATVIQNQGGGRYSVRVSYDTAAGHQEQGTLATPDDAGPTRWVICDCQPAVSVASRARSGGGGGGEETGPFRVNRLDAATGPRGGRNGS